MAIRSYSCADVAGVQKVGEWAASMADQVLDAFGVTHHPTAVRNRNRSYHWEPNGTHQVVFGYNDLWLIYRDGFREYPSIAYVWPINELHTVGYRAVRCVVLHECAHAIQERIERGSVHNGSFVEALRALREAFPVGAFATPK
jgi:hypothetical protein